MKLVAALGPPPARPPKGKGPPGAARASPRGERPVAPAALPAASSPAALANAGRELLQAAKGLLAELARSARQG
jgi:hypothetical protein